LRVLPDPFVDAASRSAGACEGARLHRAACGLRRLPAGRAASVVLVRRARRHGGRRARLSAARERSLPGRAAALQLGEPHARDALSAAGGAAVPWIAIAVPGRDERGGPGADPDRGLSPRDVAEPPRRADTPKTRSGSLQGHPCEVHVMKRSPLARSNLRFATRRCPGRWAVLTGSAAVAAALACSNAAAQLEQSVRQNLPGFTQPQGPKPSLVAPPAGAQIASSATSPAPLEFRWSLAPGAPAPQRFVICVTEAGATCNRAGPQAMLVDVAAASTQHRTWIVPSLHEKPLEWTVGACGPGYGGGMAITQGTINPDCTWADRRSISAGYVPPLINLGSPGDDVTAATPAQRFTWQQPRGV